MPTINAQLHQLSTLNDKELSLVAEEVGTNTVGLYILRELYRKDGQRPADLANAVGRAATSFTPALDRLEHLGLIERCDNPDDRRSKFIRLTRSGQKLRDVVSTSVDEAEQAMRAHVETVFGVAYPQTNGKPRVQPLPVR